MSAREEVLQAERDWLEAFLALDLETIDHLMHPDYRQIGSRGQVWSREEVLASLASGKRNWERAEVDELDVRVYGETAVVIGRWTAKGVNHGEAFDYRSRYGCVWLKHEGAWRMVLDHATDIVG